MARSVIVASHTSLGVCVVCNQNIGRFLVWGGKFQVRLCLRSVSTCTRPARRWTSRSVDFRSTPHSKSASNYTKMMVMRLCVFLPSVSQSHKHCRSPLVPLHCGSGDVMLVGSERGRLFSGGPVISGPGPSIRAVYTESWRCPHRWPPCRHYDH